MPPVEKHNVHDVFSHHPPTSETVERYDAIRAAGCEFAKVILAHTSTCADQQAAIRLVREAVFTANAAIALNGKV